MKYFLILIVIFEVYAGRGKITYDDYTVYRVTPTTDKQIDALKQIEQSDSGVSSCLIKCYPIPNECLIF